MAHLKIPTDTSQATLGYLLEDGTIPLTADWDAGAFKITANEFALNDDEPITLGTDSDWTIQNIGATNVLEIAGSVTVDFSGVNLALDVSKSIAFGTNGVISADATNTTLRGSSAGGNLILIGDTGSNKFVHLPANGVVGPLTNLACERFHAQSGSDVPGNIRMQISSDILITPVQNGIVSIDNETDGNALLRLGGTSGSDVAQIQDGGGQARIVITDGGTLHLDDDGGTDRITVSSSSPEIALTGDATISGTLGVTGIATLATSSTIGNLTLADGSITDSGGAISFGDENLSTTGTLASGALTVTGDASVSGTMGIEATADSSNVLLLGNIGSGTISASGSASVIGHSTSWAMGGNSVTWRGLNVGTTLLLGTTTGHSVLGMDFSITMNGTAPAQVTSFELVRAKAVHSANVKEGSLTFFNIIDTNSPITNSGTITGLNIPDLGATTWVTNIVPIKIANQTLGGAGSTLSPINIWQVGPNGENRLGSPTTIGADAAPTAGFKLDVQGDAIVDSRDVHRYVYSVI